MVARPGARPPEPEVNRSVRRCVPLRVTASAATTTDLRPVQRRVESRLVDFLVGKLSAGTPNSADRSLAGPIADLVLAPGKRLRAVMCFWGWRGAGGPDCPGIVTAAAALELLHGMALIHDDVIDHSLVRRGLPAVHEHFTAEHRAARWRGSATDFGRSAALLAGDLAAVWADALLRESRLPRPALLRAAPVYDAMREQAIHGQYAELIEQARGGTSAATAAGVAAAKTAASVTTGPLLFGAALAGAGEQLVRGYRGFAEPLGVAFQLRDDLLGAFGDPSLTGKPSGDDLRDGKPTLLLATARERGGEHVSARIDELLAARTPAAVREVRRILVATGARAAVERRVQDLGRQARAALVSAALPHEVRQPLGALVTAMTAPID